MKDMHLSGDADVFYYLLIYAFIYLL